MDTSPSTIANVAVVATGTGSLHPEHIYGTHKPALWWVARSKEWITVPLNVFVIEHEDGLVLFDTGMDPAAATDPDYWTVAGDWADSVVRWFLDHVFRFEIGPDDGLGSQLVKADYRPEDVKAAVLSHLHFDHVGGIGDIPDADLFVSPEAWDMVKKAKHPERDYVPRSRILVPGAKWRLLEFTPTDDPDLAPFTEACDVMGDGSLTALPTPGHLPGSISLLIRRTDAPPILLIGDLTYSEDLLSRNQVAGTGEKAKLLDSFAKVQTLKAHTPDLVIIASHDITAADKLAAAPRAATTAT